MSRLSQMRLEFSVAASVQASVLWLLLFGMGLVYAQQPASEQAVSSCSVSALSLNLHGSRDAKAILTALREAGGLDQTGVMLFQEVQRPQHGEGALDQLAHLLEMQIVFAPEFTLNDGSIEGLAVLSRYPILESRAIALPYNELFWKSRQRVALAVSVLTPVGKMRIYNLHLDTRVNLKARLRQLQPVVEEARAYDGPVLLGGDLNTNPCRWVAHTLPLVVAPDQGSEVLRYMKGLGYSSALPRKTPTSHWFRMQLDWLFVRNLTANAGAVQSIFFSDHYALHASLHPSSGS